MRSHNEKSQHPLLGRFGDSPDVLAACHKHGMIGTPQEAARHAELHGCEIDMLDELTTAEVRREMTNSRWERVAGLLGYARLRSEAETQRAASACSEPRPTVGAEPDRTGSER